MNVNQVKEILNAQILTGEELLDLEVQAACGCDLMSDVLAFVKNQALLLTGLTNPQVVRTAEMMDIKVIVFVRGKKPEPTIIELAQEKNMVLLTTKFPLYEACGRLYKAGLPG